MALFRQASPGISSLLHFFTSSPSTFRSRCHGTKPRDKVLVPTKLYQQDTAPPLSKERPIRGATVVIDRWIEQSKSSSVYSRPQRQKVREEKNGCHV